MASFDNDAFSTSAFSTSAFDMDGGGGGGGGGSLTGRFMVYATARRAVRLFFFGILSLLQ